MFQTWISFILASILFVVALIQQAGAIYWVGNLIIAILTLWAALASDNKKEAEQEKEEE